MAAAKRRRDDSRAPRREVRPVEVGAEDSGLAVAAVGFHPTAEVEESQVLVVTGDRGRGQQARRPVAGVGAADGAKGVFRPVHEVGAGAAMDVQVHEAGKKVAAVEIDDRRRRRRVHRRWTRMRCGRR